jgi:hypothetical protein
MFNIGDYVYWSDPDDNLCDTPGRITDIRGDPADPVYVIETDSGSVVEAFSVELSAVDPDLRRANGRRT